MKALWGLLLMGFMGCSEFSLHFSPVVSDGGLDVTKLTITQGIHSDYDEVLRYYCGAKKAVVINHIIKANGDVEVYFFCK